MQNQNVKFINLNYGFKEKSVILLMPRIYAFHLVNTTEKLSMPFGYRIVSISNEGYSRTFSSYPEIAEYIRELIYTEG